MVQILSNLNNKQKLIILITYLQLFSFSNGHWFQWGCQCGLCLNRGELRDFAGWAERNPNWAGFTISTIG